MIKLTYRNTCHTYNKHIKTCYYKEHLAKYCFNETGKSLCELKHILIKPYSYTCIYLGIYVI